MTCVSVRCAHPKAPCRRCKSLDCELSLTDGTCVSCQMRSARRAGGASGDGAVSTEWDRDAAAFGRGIGLVVERKFREPDVSATQRRSRP